jgi:hypothetical protein
VADDAKLGLDVLVDVVAANPEHVGRLLGLDAETGKPTLPVPP